MIGIYKITSPTKKVYIGQSVDIEKRFNTYKLTHCKTQLRLYSSLLKYGFDKHKFEVLCECEESELNDKERYYQDTFSVTSKNGLNCRLTTASDRSGKLSEETKLKMSNFQKGKFVSDKAKINMSIARRNISDETRLKMSISGKKRINTESQKLKISKSLSKLVLNIETGIYYESINEASLILGINRNTLSGYLNGRRKNNTNLIKV
jgi:group I intron endonuclease